MERCCYLRLGLMINDDLVFPIVLCLLYAEVFHILPPKLDLGVILNEVLSLLCQSRLSYVNDNVVLMIALCLLYLSDPG
jgi:hypothetical protein